VDQRAGARPSQPLAGQGWVSVGPGDRRLLLLVAAARSAHLRANGLALVQRPGQEGSLPGRLPHLRPKLLIGHVSHAQRIAPSQA
jgi:hypothetical protein